MAGTLNSGIEQGKKAAAFEAVDQHVKSNMAVGVGSGSTIVFAVDRLAQLTQNGTLTNMSYVPTSHQVCASAWQSLFGSCLLL